jgi:hypothetical protein
MAIVTVTATGLNIATAPNNFTVSIVNYLNVVTQYATNVSRASLISGYNVTVAPGDTLIRVASTGVCTYSTEIDISNEALQTYRPDPVDPTTFFEAPDSLGLNSGDVQYLIGELTIYPFMDAGNFELTHVSTEGAGGLSATGGPFIPPILEASIDPLNPTTLSLFGYTRNSYSTDTTVNTSVYKITYTPTGLSRDFNYYWLVNV